MTHPATNVLLIEDDEQDYIITRELLARAAGRQFVLQWAGRLSSGMTALANGGIDVVLLDLSLPDSQGWSTFERVRDHAVDIPIILLTGQTDESMGMRALKEGAQDYLSKGNIDSSTLGRAIRYAIERKQVELSLKQYQEHLEELVTDRTTELTWANEQLQHEIRVRREKEEQLEHALQRLKDHAQAQSDFVSNVSHELKTPLSSLTYAIENMLKGVVGAVPDRMQTYLSMMKDDCARLTGTISDILDMSRIDAHRIALHLVRLPFGPFVHRAVESLRLQAENKGLLLSCSAENGLHFVLCDPHRMERVIFNLVNNAIKFTDEGGWVTVQVAQDAMDLQQVVLTVTDSGIGIPAEHLPRVAERYFRIGEHVSGAGLGLSLCKELVTLHSGTLLVTSPPPGQEQGTMVTVRIPIAPPPNILALEPDSNALDLLLNPLAERGYKVMPCTTDEEARNSLHGAPPDVVILDSGHPAAVNFEMIAHIRSSPQMHFLPVIVLTEEPLSRAQDEILRNLQVPALQKPCSIDALLACLERAITDHHRRYTGKTTALEGAR